jgi:hypothetical protein
LQNGYTSDYLDLASQGDASSRIYCFTMGS